MTEQTGGAGADWRQLDRFLWVGVGPEGHVGTIEQGRRYVAIDADGRVRGRCATLHHAERLLEELAALAGGRRRQRGAQAV